MTVLLIVLLVITAGVLLYERSKRQFLRAIQDCTAVGDDEAVTKHQQVAVLRSVGVTLPPEQEKNVASMSAPSYVSTSSCVAVTASAAFSQSASNSMPSRSRSSSSLRHA